MAEEEQAQEKTEQPSTKRLQESREKGQVARSKDFNALVVLIFTGASFYLLGESIASELSAIMRSAFVFDSTAFITRLAVIQKLYALVSTGFWAMFPLLIVILILTLLAPISIGGVVFSSEVFQPKFSRLSPLKGLKRMVSVKSVVEMVKAFLKFLLVATVAVLTIKWEMPSMFALAHMPLEPAIARGMMILINCFMMMSASLILIAVLDVPFQLYEHAKQLKMSKQELMDEYKETEGKPEIKSQIRRRQQELARKRMMSEVPKANVILTNPTHYAVAIRYDQDGKRAPIVVAKGKDLIAFQINKVAKAHNIPTMTLPPLARALYFSTDINAEIPRGLYVAVAQVLAYVFQLKDKKTYEKNPTILQNVPIPEELQKDGEEITG